MDSLFEQQKTFNPINRNKNIWFQNKIQKQNNSFIDPKEERNEC